MPDLPQAVSLSQISRVAYWVIFLLVFSPVIVAFAGMAVSAMYKGAVAAALRLLVMLSRGRAWTLLGPAARRRLVRAGDAGDERVVTAVWQAWLSRPDDKLWQQLWRWHRPAAQGSRIGTFTQIALGEGDVSQVYVRSQLVTAAARSRHPMGQIARERILAEAGSPAHGLALVDAVCDKAVVPPGSPDLAAWCARHGLAPADPERRAAFLMLTGQHAQYRAADPDGSALALAYRAGTDQERERLRAAMAESGDLDAVRVVARTASAGRHSVTAAEAGYLADRLAARRDWNGLWLLARDLPLAGAVAATGGAKTALAAGWQPVSQQDRAQFTLLAAADRGQIASGRRALLAAAAQQAIDSAGAAAGSMSPDGRQLALATGGAQPALSVIDLPGAAAAGRYELASRPDGVLHLGESLLAWTYWTRYVSQDVSRLALCAGGTTRELVEYERTQAGQRIRLRAVRPWPGGFCALMQPWGSSSGTAGDRWVRFCDFAGKTIRDVGLADLGMPGEASLLAADPGSGRLVFGVGGGSREVRIVDAAPDRARVAGSAACQTELDGGCFAGPDRLITWRASKWHVVQSWHLGHGTPKLEAERAFQLADPDRRMRDPAAVRDSGLVAVCESASSTFTYRRAVRLLDAETLETLGGIDGLPGLRGFKAERSGQLFAAPSGRFLGILTPRSVSLVDMAAARLACRPLSALTAADLAYAAALARRPETARQARSFLELLTGVLGARLGDEVALAEAAPVAAADDVGLADG